MYINVALCYIPAQSLALTLTYQSKTMARGTSEILGELHKIICRRATDQMLFAYVRGAQAANPAVSIEGAIRSFCDCFGVNLNEGTARSVYYRMLGETRSEAQLLKDQMQV